MLATREGDVAKGVPIAPKVGKISFDEAARDVINDYKIHKRRSLSDTQRRIDKHLRVFFGSDTRLSGITTDRIREFIVARQAAGAADAEINLELAALKRMYSLAKQSGRLHHVPHIPMFTLDNARKGFLDPSQFQALCSHLPVELVPIATFGYLTGWRKGEILGLQWRHVDLEAKVVRLFAGETKNGKPRTVPYGELPELVELLEQRRAETDALEQANSKIIPWVFHRNGERIRYFQKSWATACKAAGVPGRLFHDLRRCAARNLRRAGISESVAMKITGHLTPSIFKRYDIVDETDIGNEFGKLAGTISGTNSKRTA
jgi:integrase